MGTWEGHFSDTDASPSLRRLEQVFRLIFGVFAFGCVVPLLSLAASDGWPAGETVPVLLLLVATGVTVLRWPPLLALLTMAAALVVAIGAAASAAEPAPRLLLGVVGLLLVLHCRLPRLIALLLPILVCYVALSSVIGPPGLGSAAVDDAVLVAALTLPAAVFVGVIAATVATLDRVRAERIEAELASSLESAGSEALTSSRRLLHDEVIGTLTAVADYRGRGEPEIVRACGRIADLLSNGHHHRDDTHQSVPDMVAEAAADAGLTIRIGASRSVTALDPQRADVVRRALREVLRNVRRHSGVLEATVSWWHADGHSQLQVTDAGVGTGQVVELSGLHHSVEQPLATIGGRCEIGAGPDGRGTTVLMTWPDAEQPPATSALSRTHEATIRSLAGNTALVLQVGIPVLLGNTWLALRYAWGDTRDVEQLMLALAIVATTLVVTERIRRAPLPAAALAVVALAAGASTWVGLELAGPQSLVDYNSWVIGLSCVSLTILAFFLPLGWALILLVPTTLAVTVELVLDGIPIGEGGGALLATLPVLLGHLMGAYLRDLHQSLELEEQRIQHAAAQAHRRVIDRTVAARQLEHARRSAVPWLQRIASGELSVEDARVRSAARVMSVEMRDELHAPGVLDDALRRRIARARRSGTEVVLCATTGEQVGVGPYLRLLDRALDLGTDLETVLVRFPDTDEPSGEIVLAPPVNADHLTEILRCLEGSEVVPAVDDFSTTITW